MGQMARELARRATGFGMRLLYYDLTRLSEKEEEKLGVEFRPLKKLFAESDFISLHHSSQREDRRNCRRNELSLMKPTTFLINCSRGGLVDQDALCEALENNRIAGAGLDVFGRSR